MINTQIFEFLPNEAEMQQILEKTDTKIIYNTTGLINLWYTRTDNIMRAPISVNCAAYGCHTFGLVIDKTSVILPPQLPKSIPPSS